RRIVARACWSQAVSCPRGRGSTVCRSVRRRPPVRTRAEAGLGAARVGPPFLSSALNPVVAATDKTDAPRGKRPYFFTILLLSAAGGVSRTLFFPLFPSLLWPLPRSPAGVGAPPGG